jgi:hypothetical protein
MIQSKTDVASRTPAISLALSVISTQRPPLRRSPRPDPSDILTVDSNENTQGEPTCGDRSPSGLRLHEKISVFQDWWSRNISRGQKSSRPSSRASGEKSSKPDSETGSADSEPDDHCPKWLRKLNTAQKDLTDKQVDKYRNRRVF